jgi:hypothetical protein
VRALSVRAERIIHATGTGDLLSVCMVLWHRHPAAARDKLAAANRLVARYIEGGLQAAR